MIPNYRNRGTADRVRRLLYKHVHFRQAMLIVVAVCACAVMTYTVHVLRSRTLVIKLHNSEETFVEEALHEIVLVPEKLAPLSPSETPEEVPIEQRCENLFKAKGRHCTRGRKTGKVQSMQESKILNSKDLALEEEEEEDEGGGGGGREERREDGEGSLGGRVGAEEELGLGGFELPVKEIWPARRRDWRDDEEIQRVSRVLAVNALYRRNVDLMRVKLPPRLPNFRNPCFLASPRDLTLCRSGAFKTWERFARGNKLGAANKGKRRLSCLPYFVIAGMPQTGATELLHLLSRHPDVTVPLPLQSHWMDSARFEESCGSVNAYLDFFGPTAQVINASVNDRGVHTLVAASWQSL